MQCSTIGKWRDQMAMNNSPSARSCFIVKAVLQKPEVLLFTTATHTSLKTPEDYPYMSGFLANGWQCLGLQMSHICFFQFRNERLAPFVLSTRCMLCTQASAAQPPSDSFLSLWPHLLGNNTKWSVYPSIDHIPTRPRTFLILPLQHFEAAPVLYSFSS